MGGGATVVARAQQAKRRRRKKKHHTEGLVRDAPALAPDRAHASLRAVPARHNLGPERALEPPLLLPLALLVRQLLGLARA